MRSALAKMADGNPGAMVALSSLMKYSELLKPADPFMEILALDSLHLYLFSNFWAKGFVNGTKHS